jgi:hypothetical protein
VVLLAKVTEKGLGTGDEGKLSERVMDEGQREMLAPESHNP